MTKEITKAIILQEMQDKLKLREWEPANFLFEESVIPVYDIGPHLQLHTASYAEKAITGTGGVGFFLVPSDEKWFLNGYTAIFMGAGAYTMSGVYIQRDKEKVASSFVYLNLTAGISASYTINLPKVTTLMPGDALSVNIDGYTSPQDLRLYIDYIKEEIR